MDTDESLNSQCLCRKIGPPPLTSQGCCETGVRTSGGLRYGIILMRRQPPSPTLGWLSWKSQNFMWQAASEMAPKDPCLLRATSLCNLFPLSIDWTPSDLRSNEPGKSDGLSLLRPQLLSYHLSLSHPLAVMDSTCHAVSTL